MFALQFHTTLPHWSKCSCKKPCANLLTCPTQYTDIWLLASHNYKTNRTNVYLSLDEMFTDLIEQTDVKEILCFSHALAFDGSFIIHFLAKKNIEYETVITDLGEWFQVSFCLGERKFIVCNSSKLLNQPLANFSKIFGFREEKKPLPGLVQPPREILCTWEKNALTNVKILGKGLAVLLKEQRSGNFTTGSQSFTDWAASLRKGKYPLHWRNMFPELPLSIDSFCRKAFRGSHVWLNPLFKDKELGPVRYYDINAAHKYQMMKQLLPFGVPLKITGEKIRSALEKKKNQLLIFNVNVAFSLRDGFVPTIQTKDRIICDLLNVKTTDYLTDSGGFYLNMYFTCVEWEIFTRHYDYDIAAFNTGYLFQARKNMFYNYFTQDSEDTELNRPVYLKKKYEANTLFGKFGARPYIRFKQAKIVNGRLRYSEPLKSTLHLNFNDKGKILDIAGKPAKKRYLLEDKTQYRLYDLGNDCCYREVETKSGHFRPKDIISPDGTIQLKFTPSKYVPVSIFTSAYTRKTLVAALQANLARAIYTDTDALHIHGWEEPEAIEIDDKKLGAWKPVGPDQGRYKNAKYLRAKLYLAQGLDGSFDVTGAGLTKEAKKRISFANFHLGARYGGKTVSKQILGGTGLFETTFTVNEKTGLESRY